jgi:hypothetical protein
MLYLAGGVSHFNPASVSDLLGKYLPADQFVRVLLEIKKRSHLPMPLSSMFVINGLLPVLIESDQSRNALR